MQLLILKLFHAYKMLIKCCQILSKFAVVVMISPVQNARIGVVFAIIVRNVEFISVHVCFSLYMIEECVYACVYSCMALCMLMGYQAIKSNHFKWINVSYFMTRTKITWPQEYN